jgi:uncharacterized protein GlcG (DUF336 family)
VWQRRSVERARERGRQQGVEARRRYQTPLRDLEVLEPRALLSASGGMVGSPRLRATQNRVAAQAAASPTVCAQLTPDEVGQLLSRAAAASASDDAILAVVDREGNILGVRVEGGVSPTITGDIASLTFAIDGALAEARTAAFFANNAAPLTSRTIQEISQSTITQREVQSNPSIPDPNSRLRGPGFVAPIGLKGHFPPRVMFTPQVDLFLIEHSNRDSILHPGPDQVKGTADDVLLPSRFNVPTQFIPPGQEIPAPESYGFASGLLPDALARGIGTLPGGIPIYKNGCIVGGIGVFFPGTTGYATEENSKLNDAGFFDPARPDRSEEAEYMAFAAVGGSKAAGVPIGTINGVPALPGFGLPFGRIDLVGITLDLFGGHGAQGVRNLVQFGRTLGVGDPDSGTNVPVDPMGDQLLPGQAVPDGWIVVPHDSPDGGLTADDVVGIVNRGIAEANQVRAAIRLPLDSRARMIFAVTDNEGNVLGMYSMPDATYFSFDVAVAKARNVAYYANAQELQPIDKLAGVPAGTAFTSRTFRYLSEPRFPEGIDGFPPGPFSILTDPGINPHNGRNLGAPTPASDFTSVQGYDSFNPQTNFRDPNNILNQNGVIFFPGSAPLYKDVDGSGTRVLVGGLGVSGDGVDQDDDVTFEAAMNYQPPFKVRRADQVFVRGIRLPYQKFNRQPHEPFGQPPQPESPIKPVLPRAVKRRR